MVNKVNKGEWSEFYAFLKILSYGKLYAADEEGNKDIEKYYSILSAIKKDVEYLRNETTGSIIFEMGKDTFDIPIATIDKVLDTMFKDIQEGSNTFEIPIVEPIIDKLKINSIKENSQNKGDIKLRVHDVLIGYSPVQSFSVKSYVGGAPTLLNASKGTVFTYEIFPPLEQQTVDVLNSLQKQKPRGWLDSFIQKIYENDSKCKYISVANDTFETNLQMIDFMLPEILAEIFVHGYLVANKNLNLAIESYLKYYPAQNEKLIKYKITELLVASALGMVPMTPWLGMEEANGGYIIVKNNSDVLCYHLYERNELKEYLYNNTRFETASTSRYNTGKIYQEDDRQFIDLALQIRFKQI